MPNPKAYTDLENCTANADCSCPQQCVSDHGQRLCELPCASQADCNDANVTAVACQNGFCGLDFCAEPGAAGPPPVATPCSIAGAGSGSCNLVPAPGGGFWDLCFPVGTATLAQICNPWEPGAVECAPGLLCSLFLGKLTGDVAWPACLQACTPGADAGCPTGQSCTQAYPLLPGVGVCVGGGSCSTTNLSPCTNGNNTCPNLLANCVTSADCDCPGECVLDEGTPLCELPCAQQSDCTNAGTPQGLVCRNGFCAIDYCAMSPQGPVPGQLGAPCSIADSGVEGTCTPSPNTWYPLPDAGPLGECYFNGSGGAGVACGSSWGACQSGLVCAIDYCEPFCSPGSDGGCPAGQVCQQELTYGTLGLGSCGACVPSGGLCANDGACCSGKCTSSYDCSALLCQNAIGFCE